MKEGERGEVGLGGRGEGEGEVNGESSSEVFKFSFKVVL